MRLKKYLSTLFLILTPILAIGLFFFLSIISTVPQVPFHPQKEQLFVIHDGQNNLLNVLATTLPKFAMSLADGQFSNLWQAYAQERNNDVNPTLVNDKGDAAVAVDMSFDDKKKELVVTPLENNQVKPGLYHLKVKIKTVQGKDITITQDFTWGVLAINTGKPIYQPGETVKIGMGVLDNLGDTKCITKDGVVTFPTAKVWLQIYSPSGKEQDLSTDDGSITGSKECAPTSITNNPDFMATYTPQEVGKYRIHMTAENINGTRSIDDYFTVSTTPPDFDIMRTSYPTRIYPYGHYPVAITVYARKDYSGEVSDFVPTGFTITNISDNGGTHMASTYQQILWHVNWRQGQTYTLSYEIKFPLVSPEFYLAGPLTIGNPSAGSGQSFSEGREWQIASDAIALAQTPQSNIVNSGTSVSLTWGTPPATGDLEIVVCSETSNASISTPTRGSGSPRPNTWATGFSSKTTAPFIQVFYRVATTSDASTVTCSFGSSTGVKAIQLFEYSGLSSSSPRDKSLTHHGTCTGTPTNFTSNTGTFLVNNPTELAFASFVSTNAVTVNGHTSGFTQEFGFNGSSGTFTTADQTTSSTSTDYTDTVALSTSGGTCSGGIVAFITPLNYTQGSFQFFQNANSLNTLTAIGSVNTNLTLPAPHYAFRLRFLIDVDGANTLAQNAGDWTLEYATKSAGLTCSTIPSANYDLVTQPGSQGDIAFNSNGLGSGSLIATSGTDPSDTGYTTTYESYYEDDNNGPNGPNPGDITNDQAALNNGLAGLWDVSLIDNTNDSVANTYCLKIVNNNGGSDLNAYTHIPEVTLFYNEINIKGPGNSGGTTFIKGPGNSGGTTFIK